MAKKRAHQLLVSIKSLIVLWLVCSGVDGFLTTTAAGRTLLAFALAGNVSPQQFRDWCRTGRWFSADLESKFNRRDVSETFLKPF